MGEALDGAVIVILLNESKLYLEMVWGCFGFTESIIPNILEVKGGMSKKSFRKMQDKFVTLEQPNQITPRYETKFKKTWCIGTSLPLNV